MDYQQELVNRLKNHEWMTAKELATSLNCSVRTVKKYIAQLKDEYPDSLVSSQRGYRLIPSADFIYTSNKKTQLPQTQEERMNFIIKELTIYPQNELTFDDIVELLFISESTLRNDLSQLRNRLKKYNCSLVIEKGVLSLNGDENDIRILLADIIKQESTSHFFDLGNLSHFFPEYDVKLIQKQIYQIITSYQLELSDVALASLTRHLIIMMYRIKNTEEDKTQLSTYVLQYENSLTEKIIEEIAQLLQSQYQVTLDNQEKHQLELFIYSKVFKSENMDSLIPNTTKNVCVLHLEEFIDEMNDKLNENFNLNLNHQDFKQRFALHLQGLIFRSQNNLLASNPLAKTIKLQVPFLYEISVFISELIKNTFKIQINEDEITYIVFHIGSFLEESPSSIEGSVKLHCTFFFPNIGLNKGDTLAVIHKNFSEKIIIDSVITSFQTFDPTKTGTLLVTSAIDLVHQYEHCVTISPLLTQKDLSLIHRAIDEIYEQQDLTRNQAHLSKVFSEKLFQVGTTFKDKWEVIDYMCQGLLKEGYISPSYIDDVILREKLSSTAFGKFAIPHSMNMNALQTGVFVLIQEKPIQWDEHYVNIVFLFAFSNRDRIEFRQSFEQVANKFMETKFLAKILSSKNYTEFLSHILQ